MRSSLGGISISSSAQTIAVENRISIGFYYRIADNILKQADIFRKEENFIDLYIMLLRFSSLIYETIPRHKDYRASSENIKVLLKKRLLNALSEMEKLKPIVEQRIYELNRKKTRAKGYGDDCQNGFDSSLEWSPVKRTTSTTHNIVKAQPMGRQFSSHSSRIQQFSHTKFVEQKFQGLILRPKEETLSRHSILGPNGLSGQWQPPSSDKWVQYPSNIDSTPINIPSLQKPLREDGLIDKKKSGISRQDLSYLEPIQNNNTKIDYTEELSSMISFEVPQTDIIRQPSPPPVLAEVQDLIPTMSPQVTDTHYEMEKPIPYSSIHSESPLQLHFSSKLMSDFMELAKSNTEKNLETCGVLAGVLKDRKFYITTLIIPKQESTSDTCITTNEEEIFEVQDKQSLFPLGWIHTHPTQSCFMSSVDVHTHYSYQIMLPESIAIVMAPTDTSRKHGIYRLTTPGGMTVIRQCKQRGFHSHDQPLDGGPIYEQCTDVYMDPNLNFGVIDLR